MESETVSGLLGEECRVVSMLYGPGQEQLMYTL